MTTGRPFTVTLQTGVNNGAPSWPNRIGSGKLDNPTVDLWFNPADFVAPPPNTYGDSGRGILYGPGHTNFDTSLSKRFSIGGRRMRSSGGTCSTCSITPASASRMPLIGNPTVGRITTTVVDNRSMQLALKVNF